MRPVLLEGRALHIFPCRADKKPACEHGFDDAVADQPGIDRLWSGVWERNRPSALIGVATGVISGIAVIDIDPRRGGDKWFFENRDRLPKTRTHESQSGGPHLIYRHLAGLRCSKDRIAPGVEIKGDGGYVIWWPSHGGRVLCEGPVAEFPRWLFDEVVTQLIKRCASAPNGKWGDATLLSDPKSKWLPRNLYFQVLKLVPLSTLITRHDQRRVCGWLSGVVHAPEGSRNDWLFWAACRFGEFVGVPSNVAEQLLFAAASGLVEDDGRQSVMATIRSGLRSGSASSVASPHFDDRGAA
jgi:hypothetical protein